MPGLFGIFDHGIGLERFEEVEKPAAASAGPNNLTIIADTCLTNRTELITKFGVSLSEHPDYPDTRLILKSYEKWGEDCVDHLSGSFAFAIWDKENRRLFCARDHFGCSKFFYSRFKDRFVFADSPSRVAKLAGIKPKLNTDKFAVFLLPEPHTLTSEQTWFEDIYPLPAGTFLTLDAGGMKTRRYWKPEINTDQTFKNNEETLEAFRELMFEIIEARMEPNDKVSALLSGGIDSSAIVSVAAKVLERKNRQLEVFSAVLPENGYEGFSDERVFIDQFRSFPNINIKYVSVPGRGPFTDLEQFFENYDSPVTTSRHYLYRAFTEEARRIGSTTLLEGSFGEFGPATYGEGILAELFGRFRWFTLWRELRLRSKLYGTSIKYDLRANIVNPVIPDFLFKLRHANSSDKPVLNNNHPFMEDFFQDLVKKTDLPEDFYGRVSSDHRENQLKNLKFLQVKFSETPSSTLGIEQVEYRYPYLDKRLLEFCLAVPLDLKMHDGYSRYLVRSGLDNVLPRKIQWRTTKTPFSPDYIRRYFAQIGEVKQLLADIKPNDPLREVLDIEKIAEWVDFSCSATDRYTTYDELAFNRIPQAIYLIYFLRRFSEFRL